MLRTPGISGSTSRARFGSLSIVLPAYNEENTVEEVVRAGLRELDRRAVPGEVIVVDDGSWDRTGQVLAGIADPRVRVRTHRENRGYGAALMRGIRESRFDWIFFTDTDLQFDVRELDRLEAHIEAFDLVVGYRRPRVDAIGRRVNGWAWTALQNGLLGLGIRDVDCAFKVFHRRVFEQIGVESKGAFVNGEILARAKAAGFLIQEVPVTHFPRRAGVPTGSDARVIGRACWELGRMVGELRGR